MKKTLAIYKKTIFCLAGAIVLVVGLSALGTWLLRPLLSESAAWWLLTASTALLATGWMVTLVWSLRRKKDSGMRRQVFVELNALRDNVQLRLLLKKRLQRRLLLLDCYTVVSVILAVTTSLLLYQRSSDIIFPLVVFYSMLERFCHKEPKLPAEGVAAREDFPLQYALAEKAQQAVDSNREIVIYHSGECTASIALVGNRVGLVLGAMLLDIYTQEEVYQVMLHEFAHVADREEYLLERRYHSYGVGHWFDLVDMYCYKLHYYYSVFTAQDKEKRADSALTELGAPQIAANALAKLAYFTYYEGSFISSGTMLNLYQGEEMPRQWLQLRLQDFKTAMARQGELARELLAKELPPRVSSHPIIRQRIQALGVEDVSTRFPDHQDAWGGEVHKAVEQVNAAISKDMAEIYTQKRENIHVKPLQKLEDWHCAGKPLSYEDTREIVETLFAYQRYPEVLELSQAFGASGASENERCHVIYYEGLARLRLRDNSGLELLYQAIELNRNYEEQGLDAIATYCATLGLEEEMERYRAYADRKAEGNLDIQPTFPLGPKDDICPSDRDDEVFRENLQVILGGSELLNRVFLVKKNTSPQTHDYIYILEFREGVGEERQEELYDTIFMHLDKQEEQYSLALLDEGSGKGWLEKRPEYLVYKHSDN